MSAITFSNGETTDRLKSLFSEEEFSFLSRMHQKYNERRNELLKNRVVRQRQFDEGACPEYDKESIAATSDWKVAPIPEDLKTRRVEITGPINDPKMVINMLSRNNAGFRADTAMLDFEDSMKPSWNNVVCGLENIKAVSEGNLSHEKIGASGEVKKLIN